MRYAGEILLNTTGTVYMTLLSICGTPGETLMFLMGVIYQWGEEFNGLICTSSALRTQISPLSYLLGPSQRRGSP